MMSLQMLFTLAFLSCVCKKKDIEREIRHCWVGSLLGLIKRCPKTTLLNYPFEGDLLKESRDQDNELLLRFSMIYKKRRPK